jgi:hypothetical protein
MNSYTSKLHESSPGERTCDIRFFDAGEEAQKSLAALQKFNHHIMNKTT